MPKNLFCNVLGSSPNVQNLLSKIFAKYCKRLISKVSSRSRPVQVSISFRVFAQSLGLVSVSQRQCLVSVSKISAETPALVIIFFCSKVGGILNKVCNFWLIVFRQ